jgi:hypothetical protein
MSPKTMWLLVVLVVCVYPLSASTYWVGTCHEGSFPTIMAAVTSSNVAPGSTINVCPGGYQEQVIISKPLTLQGVVASDSSDAEIFLGVDPSVTESPVLETQLTPTVWVTTGPVIIQNILVSTPQTGGECPSVPVVGFYYTSGASGKLNGVVFSSFNSSNPPCPGWGIWLENGNSAPTSVTVSNSFSDSGILAAALEPLPNIRLTVSITENQMFINRALGTGISVSQVGGVVKGNFIQPASGALGSYKGIYDDAPSATISGNTILGDDFSTDFTEEVGKGIVINDDGARVMSNKITNIGIGVELNCHSATVTGDTISLANIGIDSVPSLFAGSNTFRTVFSSDVARESCP